MVENRPLERPTVRREAPGDGGLATSPFGNPVPLGLLAFSTSAFTLGTVLAGWWPSPARSSLFLLAMLIIFGGIAQFVAGMWSYSRGSTLVATFLTCFGAMFALVGFGGLLAVGRAQLVVLAPALGPLAVAVGCFGFIALVVAIGTWRSSFGLSVTSLALTISLFFVAWSLFAVGNGALAQVGGWFGVIAGILGFATAAATALSLGLDRPIAIPHIGIRRAA
jgi:succinate-acetate transporter protein